VIIIKKVCISQRLVKIGVVVMIVMLAILKGPAVANLVSLVAL
jgi:hypothetical protein